MITKQVFIRKRAVTELFFFLPATNSVQHNPSLNNPEKETFNSYTIHSQLFSGH